MHTILHALWWLVTLTWWLFKWGCVFTGTSLLLAFAVIELDNRRTLREHRKGKCRAVIRDRVF